MTLKFKGHKLVLIAGYITIIINFSQWMVLLVWVKFNKMV